MLRFLLTRRWLGLLLAVVVVSLTCVELGRWQFRRYAARQDRNATTRANLDQAPVPAADVLSTQRPPAAGDEWRRVVARGTYDADRTVVVIFRTRDGAPGVDVVTPLVGPDGTALLVDRGWVPTTNNANRPPEVPAPPAGDVVATGWVRIGADPDDAGSTPSNGAVRAISPAAIAETLPYDTYQGFLDLTSEQPSGTPAPSRAERPDLGSGPHFFYGLQWFFFAGLALVFWGYFARAEYVARRDAARSAAGPPAADHADAQHGVTARG